MRGCVGRHRVVVRGVSYAVRKHGVAAAGGTVMLLHGFAGSADDWRDLSETLGRAGLRAIAVDLPGHGATDCPVEPACYDPERTAQDLVTILSSFGADRAHWVGYSMGARIALRVALDAPSRVASLVLESATTGIPDDEARVMRRERDEALATEIGARGIAWFVPYWESQPIFRSQASLPAARRDVQRTRRLLQRPEGLARSLRGSGQGATRDLTDRLDTIGRPVLLVAGGLDPAYEAHAKRMAARIPNATVRIVPEAGHNVHLERPEEFSRVVHDHLASVGRGDPAGASPFQTRSDS